MAINDIYELTFTQRWGAAGEKMLNKFFYRAKDADGTAQALHAAFGSMAGMMGGICTIQSTLVFNYLIRVVNLWSLTDFYEEGVNSGGQVAGDVLPMHSAVNFSLKLDTRGVAPGSKRFSGIPEAVQSAGIINDATEIAALHALEVLLSSDIEDATSGAVFEPVVVKRIKELVTPELPRLPYYTYRLPAEESELDYGKVVSALVNLFVSHQVSRGNRR